MRTGCTQIYGRVAMVRAMATRLYIWLHPILIGAGDELLRQWQLFVDNRRPVCLIGSHSSAADVS